MKRAQNPSQGAPAFKKSKHFRNMDENVNLIPLEERRLDSLARLLQETSQGCAAVCLINQTIIIADNEIHEGTKLGASAGSKLKLIKAVMNYFSELANKQEKLSISREDVFKKLCIARLKGEEKGYIKLQDVILGEIAEDILISYKASKQENWRVKYAKKNGT